MLERIAVKAHKKRKRDKKKNVALSGDRTRVTRRRTQFLYESISIMLIRPERIDTGRDVKHGFPAL
jgi:hypothetical protein